MKIIIGACATILGLMLTSGAAHADPDHNLQIMIDATRQLTWDDWIGDNLANLLVKQETIVTPVAVIFGYVDNAVACEALAHALSQPQSGLGTFKCQPIF
jgi:hypothetical protein